MLVNQVSSGLEALKKKRRAVKRTAGVCFFAASLPALAAGVALVKVSGPGEAYGFAGAGVIMVFFMFTPVILGLLIAGAYYSSRAARIGREIQELQSGVR